MAAQQFLKQANGLLPVRASDLPTEIVGRESGFAYFKEGDEVRVNDDAVLAPDAIRGEVGTVKKVNRFLTSPAQVSESTIAVDRYQQLVKQPRETQILGLALQVYFPKIGDSMLVASNEVTLLVKFKEAVAKLEERLLSHLRDPQQFCVLGDGGLDVPFVNQSFDAVFFGDIVRYVLRPRLSRDATKVLSPEASGPPLAAVYASMAGLSFVRAVKVYDKAQSQVPASWRGAVVGDLKVRSATKGTENYFAIPEGAIGPDDRVIIFDDVGFTGKTRKAVVQLVEKSGARVSSIVNVIEKFYGEPRDTVANARAILGIGGFEPKGQRDCSITITELFMERLKSPKIVDGVRYEPGRSLSSINASQSQ
jgi:adenine/guanine phosphoribosyltransferase-like PRPP-binding protein